MIHYMVGEKIPHSKTGCDIRSVKGEEPFEFVYWRERHKVDCPKCLDKIARLNFLLERRNLMTKEPVSGHLSRDGDMNQPRRDKDRPEKPRRMAVPGSLLSKVIEE